MLVAFSMPKEELLWTLYLVSRLETEPSSVLVIALCRWFLFFVRASGLYVVDSASRWIAQGDCFADCSTELADWRSFLKLHSHVAIPLRVSLRWMVEWGKQTGLCGFFLNHSLSVWRKHTCLLIYSKNSGSIGILQNELIIIPALSWNHSL